MAKAKVLADRCSITSEILTDANLERVSLLAPSVLTLKDAENESTILYQVVRGELDTFTVNGAAFKDGKSLCTISEGIMSLDKDARENKIKLFLSAVLTKIDAIEEQVKAYLEDAEDLSEEVEFLD